MRMKSRRTLAVLLSMILLLALAPSGFAVNLEPGANTVIVNLVPTNQSDMEKDLAEIHVQADLYLLAPAVRYEAPFENVDSYTYQVPAENDPYYDLLSQLTKELNDAEKPESPPAEEAVFQQFEPYAQAFAGIVLESRPEIQPSTTKSTLDGQTMISVSGLNAGLYLLIIRGSDLSTKDDNSQTGYVKKTEQASGTEGAEKTTLYTTRVVTEDYEYLYRPQLLTVPTKLDKTTPQYNTAFGEWTNELIIYAKPTRVANNGDLKIIKNVNNPGPDPVDFVFEVSWLGKDRIPVTKVVSMTFEGETRKEYVLANTVPIGTEVTVTEVHSGIGYTAEISSRTATIVATPTPTEGAASADSADSAGIAEVVFTNDHTGPGGGHGILNRFTAGSDKSFDGVGFNDSEAADANKPLAG